MCFAALPPQQKAALDHHNAVQVYESRCYMLKKRCHLEYTEGDGRLDGIPRRVSCRRHSKLDSNVIHLIEIESISCSDAEPRLTVLEKTRLLFLGID